MPLYVCTKWGHHKGAAGDRVELISARKQSEAARLARGHICFCYMLTQPTNTAGRNMFTEGINTFTYEHPKRSHITFMSGSKTHRRNYP